MRASLLLCAALLLTAAYEYVTASAQSTPASPALPLWSTYRPNLYFGVRARHPASPLFGLAWSAPFTNLQQSVDSIRLDAEERDKVKQYGYTVHDAHRYAKQEIIDPLQTINITTRFLPITDADSVAGGIVDNDSKNAWMATVDARPLGDSGGAVPVSLYWFVQLMDPSHSITVERAENDRQSLTVRVNTGDDFGTLTFTVNVAAASHPSIALWTDAGQSQYDCDEPLVSGVKTETPWETKSLLRNALIASVNQQFRHAQKFAPPPPPNSKQSNISPNELFAVLPNEVVDSANVVYVQHVVTLPTTLTFTMTDSHSPADAHINIDSLTKGLESKFTEHFNEVFPISNDNRRRVARAALSNLLGGIGYFYGSSLIEVEKIITDKNNKRKRIRETKQTQPLSLLSGSPSRSFFPRGFLWDEGFHLLLTSQYSLPLATEVLDSWYQHIQPSGWLPREQILGEEARNRVPSEFQVQKPTIANPPTLILVLGRMVERINERVRQQQRGEMTVEIDSVGQTIEDDREPLASAAMLEADIGLLSNLLVKHFPAIQKHVDWYWKTQSPIAFDRKVIGNPSLNLSSPVTFRWNGRSIGHCLASGLDDYPRASWLPTIKDTAVNGTSAIVNEGEGHEGHVDLHSWMIALTRTMSVLAQFLAHYSPPNTNSDQSFQSLSAQYSAKSEQLLSTLDRYHWNDERQLYCDYAYKRGVRQWVCHVGYVSLLPLMLGHVAPSSHQFRSLLTHLRAKHGVWSEWGVRSLAQSDALFGSGEDYWRGHIWFNMNYLLVQSLAHYAANTASTTHDSTGAGGEASQSIIDRVLSAITGSDDDSVNESHTSLLTHLTPLSFNDASTVSHSLHSQTAAAYRDLRRALIDTVVKGYNEQGFLYEQYNATSGRGQRSHPFTGWTALVVNLMAEKF